MFYKKQVLIYNVIEIVFKNCVYAYVKVLLLLLSIFSDAFATNTVKFLVCINSLSLCLV